MITKNESDFLIKILLNDKRTKESIAQDMQMCVKSVELYCKKFKNIVRYNTKSMEYEFATPFPMQISANILLKITHLFVDSPINKFIDFLFDLVQKNDTLVDTNKVPEIIKDTLAIVIAQKDKKFLKLNNTVIKIESILKTINGNVQIKYLSFKNKDIAFTKTIALDDLLEQDIKNTNVIYEHYTVLEEEHSVIESQDAI